MNNRYLLGVLIFAVSVVGLSMGATLPLVALRLHGAGAGSLAIGLMSALPAAGMILAALLVHRLCRHFSGRQLYLICFALCLLGCAALLADQAPLAVLAGARLLLGVGMGVLVILGESWVNELCDERKRGQIVALYAACFTGCQLGGPAMISLFGAASAWPVWLVLATNLLALALVWRSLPADLVEAAEDAPRRFSLLGFVRIAPALCLGVLFFAFFDAVVLSLFPVYASSHGWAVGVAALMASVILGGDMLFQVPLGWLSDRVDRRALHLGCGVLTLALGLALPWLIGQGSLLWPALVVLGAAAGGIYTLALVLIGQHFRGPDLVTANACVGMLWGVGSLLGPLLSGALMSTGPQGLPLALCLAASLFVVAAFGALPLTRRVFS
ncbi:MFS transporter [Pseudomonas sp. Gutcm_11s]|uniref:MFS transporter n=1 Tax=Pseudomonas sp. Gutcm_11s TaxID=3026088 RepID=UPI002360E6AB|nr:MFS transporter [Pseudomonas sp. Gutcm_11s]MDD0843041.1 MFS transporter [Pseudomonas sp. Gutcm_11s]